VVFHGSTYLIKPLFEHNNMTLQQWWCSDVNV